MGKSHRGTASTGTGPDSKHGLAECYGDFSTEDCILCYADAHAVLLGCFPYNGQVFLDGCFMRIENYNFYDEYAGKDDTLVCGNETRSGVFWNSVRQAVANAMTTPVVNNSVFKGFFEKQKLTGPNFIEWYKKHRIVLSVKDKLNYLEHHIPAAPIPAQAGQQVAPEALVTHAAWELKTLFAQQAEQEHLQTMREFHSCKQKEGQFVSSYVLKMKSYTHNLEHLGHPVTTSLGVSLILISLRKEFDGFVQNYNMYNMGKTSNELHAMLKLHEQTLLKNNAPALHAIRVGKVQKGNNKHKKPQSQSAARGQNQRKGKVSSLMLPSPRFLLHPIGKIPLRTLSVINVGASGSYIFTIELYTFPNKSWVYDTGCGTHIRNTTQGLRGSRKLKPDTLSLYVSNGQPATVEAIGSYHLSLLSGLVIVLNNCHYAPFITRGIILVSCLYDDGYVNQFVDNSIQVSRNNMVYFSVIPQDCIFEIDLSDSYTNHKHEVFETFKVFKKEVENQLGKTIKLLRSDRGGEYISQEFLDHLKDHRIIAHRVLLLTHHNTMGCEALVKRDTLTKPDKLEPRSINCIFVGYPTETIGYSFYYPPENKVLVARNVEFLKNILITQEASGSLEDLEIIQEDMHPSIDTSLNHKEDDLEIDEPQRDLGEPTNYKAALLDLESDKWLNAMNVETQSMKDNEVWDLVELPHNGKTIGNKWLFKKKIDIDGAVHTYKAHFMANGYTQTPGIDYEETFSLVADIRAIRILITIATFYDCDIKFIYGLGVVLTIEDPISMYFDNTEAITIANESGITKCARHFHAKVHYLREVIEYGDVKLEKVHTDDNLAGPFTKTLAFPKHSEHTKNIGMLLANTMPFIYLTVDLYLDGGKNSKLIELAYPNPQVKNITKFIPNFVNAMEDITTKMKMSFFRTTVTATKPDIIYGLAQCFGDLSTTECLLCYAVVRTTLTHCIPGNGGQVYLSGCHMRFENYSFFAHQQAGNFSMVRCANNMFRDINVFAESARKAVLKALETAPKSKRKKLAIVMAISSILAFSVGSIIDFYAWKRKSESKRKGFDDTKLLEIVNGSNLNFKYSTIEKATSSFDEANKLGQGGFGTVYKMENRLLLRDYSLTTGIEQGTSTMKFDGFSIP
nr:zinc finger, CCHC-type [Tanacetum cinerariifolium]